MLIRSVLNFFGPNGEKLEELRLCDAETGLDATEDQIKKELQENEPLVVYLGLFVVKVAIQNEAGEIVGERPQEMRFPINASNRKEAFEQFEASAKAAIEFLKKENQARQEKARQSQLIIPNAAQSEAINNLRLAK